ncbi:MAG: hypothetical protein M3R17_09540 [Bacteroidota bacterium]|nr:hypothetical protein [Bacteroidota bacterium]
MWTPDIKEWQNISIDVYKFCYQQGEERLNTLISDGEKITNKCYTLIGLLLPVLSICLGMLIKDISKPILSLEVILSIIAVIILGGCVFYLTKLIRSRPGYPSGIEPEKIFCAAQLEFEGLEEEEKLLKSVYYNEMQHIQYKIEKNRTSNAARIATFDKVLYTIIITTIIFLGSVLSLTVL